MAATGFYTILTGAEMVQNVSGVPQILNLLDAPLSPTGGLVGSPRPSKTLFSAILTNLVVATEDDSNVKFFIIVPQPLNVSDGVPDAAPQWMPILSFSPMDSDSATYSTVQPSMYAVNFPNPTTRVLEIDLVLQGASVCSFMVSINFKHSIV
jgi:hypothetical protein